MVDGTTAAMAPSAVSLASTFDVSIISELGELLATEVVDKQSDILLAPTGKPLPPIFCTCALCPSPAPPAATAFTPPPQLADKILGAHQYVSTARRSAAATSSPSRATTPSLAVNSLPRTSGQCKRTESQLR